MIGTAVVGTTSRGNGVARRSDGLALAQATTDIAGNGHAVERSTVRRANNQLVRPQAQMARANGAVRTEVLRAVVADFKPRIIAAVVVSPPPQDIADGREGQIFARRRAARRRRPCPP